MVARRTLSTATLTLALLLPAGSACSTTSSPTPAPGPANSAEPTTHRPTPKRVLAISVDGFNTAAIRRLGRSVTPTLHWLIRHGASTLNARTEWEQTVTLPNHTSMLTGRRIDRRKHGHGVTWDKNRPGSTVQRAARRPVSSVFSVVHSRGGSTALFSTKSKFGLYERSWPKAINRFTVNEHQPALVRAARSDLLHKRRTFTVLHFSLPDKAGHAHGGQSRAYLEAVRRTDRLLGGVLHTIRSHPAIARRLTVILTSDHGFAPGATDHSKRTLIANYRIPFLVWGPSVRPADLYRLNPGYRDPGTRRPTYAGEQPVRNGDLANLATRLLGMPDVPGSRLGTKNLLVR